MARRKQQNNSISRKATIASLVIGFLFLSITIIRAAWTEPTQAPPLGNTPGPIWSEKPSQTLNGSLSVGTPGSYVIGLSGTGTTAGVKGISSAGNAVYGELGSDGGGGERAIYGLAADAQDYALYASGGLGIGLASGDIWFTLQNSSISWPRESDGAGLAGIKVETDGTLRLSGHGGGINFTDQNSASRMTISEAGIVNVVAGGKLQVGGTDVCLKGDASCFTVDTPNLQSVTETGNTTNIGISATADIITTTKLQGLDVKATQDLLSNSLKSRTVGADNIWLGDTDDIIQIQSDLKVGDSGAFGNYDPSATFKVTTPSLYSLEAQIGGATGGLKGAGTLNAVQLCISGNCKSTDWGTVPATREYINIPVIDGNDYLCSPGFVMVGVKNTNPAKLICEKLW